MSSSSSSSSSVPSPFPSASDSLSRSLESFISTLPPPLSPSSLSSLTTVLHNLTENLTTLPSVSIPISLDSPPHSFPSHLFPSSQCSLRTFSFPFSAPLRVDVIGSFLLGVSSFSPSSSSCDITLSIPKECMLMSDGKDWKFHMKCFIYFYHIYKKLSEQNYENISPILSNNNVLKSNKKDKKKDKNPPSSSSSSSSFNFHPLGYKTTRIIFDTYKGHLLPCIKISLSPLSSHSTLHSFPSNTFQLTLIPYYDSYSHHYFTNKITPISPSLTLYNPHCSSYYNMEMYMVSTYLRHFNVMYNFYHKGEGAKMSRVGRLVEIWGRNHGILQGQEDDPNDLDLFSLSPSTHHGDHFSPFHFHSLLYHLSLIGEISLHSSDLKISAIILKFFHYYSTIDFSTHGIQIGKKVLIPLSSSPYHHTSPMVIIDEWGLGNISSFISPQHVQYFTHSLQSSYHYITHHMDTNNVSSSLLIVQNVFGRKYNTMEMYDAVMKIPINKKEWEWEISVEERKRMMSVPLITSSSSPPTHRASLFFSPLSSSASPSTLRLHFLWYILTLSLSNRIQYLTCKILKGGEGIGVYVKLNGNEGRRIVDIGPSPNSVTGTTTGTTSSISPYSSTPLPPFLLSPFHYKLFWGKKCELRRFADGQIAYSTIWSDGSEGGTDHKIKGKIIGDIGNYIMGEYNHMIFNDSLNVNNIQYISYQYDNLLHLRPIPSLSPSLSPYDITIHEILSSYQDLTRIVKDMSSSLPLGIVSIRSGDEIFRLTALFLPFKCHEQNENNSNDNRHRFSPPSRLRSIPVMIELESSPKWTEDPIVTNRLKAAFYIQFGSLLDGKHVRGGNGSTHTQNYNSNAIMNDRITCVVRPTGCIVLINGYAFELIIYHTNEVLIRRLRSKFNRENEYTIDENMMTEEERKSITPVAMSNTNDHSSDSQTSDLSSFFPILPLHLIEKQYYLLPLLTTHLKHFSTLHPLYPITTRLFKRFLSSHFFTVHHISNDTIDILVAAAFAHCPYRSPASLISAIYMVWKWMGEYDFGGKAVVVDLVRGREGQAETEGDDIKYNLHNTNIHNKHVGPLSSTDILNINTHFTTSRREYPHHKCIYLSTNIDKQSMYFTHTTPTANTLQRLIHTVQIALSYFHTTFLPSLTLLSPASSPSLLLIPLFKPQISHFSHCLHVSPLAVDESYLCESIVPYGTEGQKRTREEERGRFYREEEGRGEDVGMGRDSDNETDKENEKRSRKEKGKGNPNKKGNAHPHHLKKRRSNVDHNNHRYLIDFHPLTHFYRIIMMHFSQYVECYYDQHGGMKVYIRGVEGNAKDNKNKSLQYKKYNGSTQLWENDMEAIIKDIAAMGVNIVRIEEKEGEAERINNGNGKEQRNTKGKMKMEEEGEEEEDDDEDDDDSDDPMNDGESNADSDDDDEESEEGKDEGIEDGVEEEEEEYHDENNDNDNDHIDDEDEDEEMGESDPSSSSPSPSPLHSKNETMKRPFPISFSSSSSSNHNPQTHQSKNKTRQKSSPAPSVHRNAEQGQKNNKRVKMEIPIPSLPKSKTHGRTPATMSAPTQHTGIKGK